VRPLLLLLVACSGKSDEASPPPALERSEVRRSIDVTVTGAPLSIRGVELAPSRTGGGVLELGYRVDGAKGVAVPGEITCRVGPYNLVYPATPEGKVAGPRLTAQFRPDPFAELPTLCEVAFFTGKQRIASACYRAGELADGACPQGSFPAPLLETKHDVDLARATMARRDASVVITGIFTVANVLPDARRFAATVACADTKGPIEGEGPVAFLQLDRLAAGTSVYGPLAIFLDRSLDDTAQCTLTFVSRATSGPPAERDHGSYCFTPEGGEPGPCDAN
jgi:hypothetical protein